MTTFTDTRGRARTTLALPVKVRDGWVPETIFVELTATGQARRYS